MLYKRDTYIIVTVNTTKVLEKYGNEIGPGEPPEVIKDEDNGLIGFSDNRGDLPGSGNVFKSNVDSSKDIIWIGIAQENQVTVQIKKVQRISGAEILRKPAYDDNDEGVVIGKTKDKDTKGTEKYSVTFQIDEIGLYKIDPQLEMNP